jgi:TRAP-type C4-dicarboxylate transport system substrate-binding protein
MKRTTLAAMLAISATPVAAQTEPMVLKFGNAGAPASLSFTVAQTAFAEAVTKDSDGALRTATSSIG